MKPVGSNESFYDFAKLGELKAKAASDPSSDEAIKQVSKQFEAVFLQMMLKSMRDATPKGGLLDSSATETFEQMHDQQLVQQMSEQGSVGIGKMVEQYIRRSLSFREAESPNSQVDFFKVDMSSNKEFPVDSESVTFPIPEGSAKEFLLNRVKPLVGGLE